MMKIEIHEIVAQQPCHGFKVVLFNNGKRNVLFENDQFDHWWTYIRGTREQYLGEAQKKAVEFSETIGCEVNLDPRRDLYAGQLWATLAEAALKIKAEDIETSARSVARFQARQLKILLGVLGHPDGGPSISFCDGEWVLYTWDDAIIGQDIICRHEDWVEFIELCAEYSDYVEGDDNG